MRPVAVIVTSQRLEALRKREQTLRAAIAVEATRQQKLRARQHAKLIGLLGDTLLRHAEATPTFKIMLQQVLTSAVADDKQRAFLEEMGWLSSPPSTSTQTLGGSRGHQ